MFYYLNGKIAALDTNLAVVDCGGVGFACHVSNYTLSQLRVGEDTRLYTYCSIREDAFDIFGFAEKEEKRLFEKLISVSGVGPRVALAILSVATPEQLTLAIMTGDAKTITMASGVGPKVAQRVILELKDKLGGELDFSGGVSMESVMPAQQTGKIATATQALVGLEFTQAEAAAALKGADTENMSVEELIRYALRKRALS